MSRHHAKLNRRRWRAVRRAVLRRDGFRCVKCGKAGRLEVDHRQRIEDGGAEYDPDNLQALCRGCHIAKSARENRKPESPERAEWTAYLETLI